MCAFCEPRLEDGEEVVAPLPTPDGCEDGRMMGVVPSDMGYVIATWCFPPDAAGPIRYCPMCGRKLVSE